MKSHDGCHICKILYKSELVAVQHLLSVKHHKRYECVQKEAGKPISHFCPVCGIGNIPDCDLWVVHVRSAFHKKNFDQYMQIFYAQKKVLKQSKAMEVSKDVQPNSDKKGDSSRGTPHNLQQEATQFPLHATLGDESISHGSRSHRLDQPRQSIPAGDIPAITCSRQVAIATRRGGTSRRHSDPRHLPQPSNFDVSQPLLNADRTPQIHHLPPRPFYPTCEPFYATERRGGRFEPPINRERDEAPPRYLRKPSFESELHGRPNDRYHYVRPSTPDTRSVFDYRHTRHYSEEPIFPSELAPSRPPYGYYRSHPRHHVGQASRYSPDLRRRGSGTHSHYSSRPFTSHDNRSPDSNRHRISGTHSHSNRASTSHDNRRSSHSNRSRTSQPISRDSSRRRISHGHKAPENLSQKEVILEDPESTQHLKNDEGQDKSKLPSEVEIIQLESEPEILDEAEGTNFTTDPNPENENIETPEVAEKESEPQQEVRDESPEVETKETNGPLNYDSEEPFPSKRRRKRSREQSKKKEKGYRSADISRMERHEEDGADLSTSASFSPSDRQFAFMTTVQKTHEVSKLSDEIEKLNEHQAKLTYYIRQLKFIRNQKREEKRKLRRRRSVLLAEMNQSDSQAETGSSDYFDDSTPPHIEFEDLSEGVIANQIPVVTAGEIPTTTPEPMEEVETAELLLKADESQQLTTDSSGRPVISIDDEEDEVVDDSQYRPPSKRTRPGSVADGQIEGAEQQSVSTKKPKRKSRRRDTLTRETSATPQSRKRKRGSKKATESSENIPPADQALKDPTIPISVNNTILLQTFGEAPIGANTSMGKQKLEEPSPDTVTDPPVDRGSRVNQKRLRFVRGLLSHPKCKDYTFEELDKLISDYSKDKLLQTNKLKGN